MRVVLFSANHWDKTRFQNIARNTTGKNLDFTTAQMPIDVINVKQLQTSYSQFFLNLTVKDCSQAILFNPKWHVHLSHYPKKIAFRLCDVHVYFETLNAFYETI